MPYICDAINHLRVYPVTKLFEHCGYLPGGTFMPEKGLQPQNLSNLDLNIETR